MKNYKIKMKTITKIYNRKRFTPLLLQLMRLFIERHLNDIQIKTWLENYSVYKTL